jgi:hypothetical protein
MYQTFHLNISLFGKETKLLQPGFIINYELHFSIFFLFAETLQRLGLAFYYN